MRYFQVLSKKGTVKELTHQEYRSRIHREGYHLGWIDERNIYFVRPTMLTKFELFLIEKLGGWAI